jgi:inosose dehydratase
VTHGPTSRIAAAPISWGVCEVPGWGHQLAPRRVLEEMRATGLRATEAGPEGFLPGDPRAAAALLAEHGLTLVGAFVPVVLHGPGAADAVGRAAARLHEAGAGVAVLAAVGAHDAYDERPDLDDAEWDALLAALDEAAAQCAEHDVRCALHPHIGTAVEHEEDVERVLAGSSAGLCLDTGHLLVGGTDPVALAERAGDRVSHVHLKDVDAGLTARVQAGELPYSEAVRDGLYRPLGQGAVDVAALVHGLEDRGFDGYYVLEQDVMLAAEPAVGEGPAADVRASAAHLHAVLEARR